MDTSTAIYIIAGIIIVGFIILAMLKGIIKMILLFIGIIAAIGAWYWMNKYGASYLSFITSDPSPWMVAALAWASAILILAVFIHALTWFGNVFSLTSKIGLGGIKGLLTTIIMALVVCWIGLVALFHYGSLAEIGLAYQTALARITPGRETSTPWVYTWSRKVREADTSKWLTALSPMQDPERVSLAKIIASLAPLDDRQASARFAELETHIPRPRRLWLLSRDPAVKKHLERGDTTALLNHHEITKILSDSSTREAIRRYPVDTFVNR